MAAIQNIPMRPQTYSASFLKAESVEQQPAAENTQVKKRKGRRKQVWYKNQYSLSLSWQYLRSIEQPRNVSRQILKLNISIESAEQNILSSWRKLLSKDVKFCKTLRSLYNRQQRKVSCCGIDTLSLNVYWLKKVKAKLFYLLNIAH